MEKEAKQLKEGSKARIKLGDDQLYLAIKFMYIFLAINFLIFLVLTIRVQRKIAQVDELLAKYDELFKAERIPVEEEIKHYIRSLPIPKDDSNNVTENNTITTLQVSTLQSKKILKLNYNINCIEESEAVKEGIEVKFKTTAYCPCKKCCGKTNGITASGAQATAWHTIAAGKDYPFGTRIYIPELADMPNGGWFEVEDRGGAISNSRLDVFFETHQEAIEYGIKELTGYVYYPEEPE